MSAKPKQCTFGPKHKWVWLKNTRIGKGSFAGGGHTVQISLKGIYKCECGEKKIGQPNWEDRSVAL